MRTRDRLSAKAKPWRALLWMAMAGVVCGVLGLGEILEDTLRSARNSLHPNSASGDIVLVELDNRSVKKIGRWPWPRRYHAQLIDGLTKAGAKRIFFDVQFYSASEPADDAALADAIKRSGRVVLPVNSSLSNGPLRLDQPPLPMFSDHSQLATISINYNYHNAVWRLPFALAANGAQYPGMAAKLADVNGPANTTYMVDYSIRPESVPSVSAISVIDGSIDPRSVAGKDVVIGATSNSIGDVYFIPGFRQAGGVYVQIIGAETLKTGHPVSLGWLPVMIVALFIASLAVLGKVGEKYQPLVLGAGILGCLVGPATLESRLIHVEIVPGLIVLAITVGLMFRRRFRKRGLVDPVSGLPNLTALKSHRGGKNQALIAARVLNYAEVVAALPPNSERQLVEQIVTRLSVGDRDREYFQGDDGIFAWFDEPGKPFGHHLEALHALFRTPVRVGGMSIDLSISFGVEIGSSRSLANRLGSALVAAEQAGHDGLKWKCHDPDSLQDASWKLSMLSQLDEAVDRGEVWAAYQPKVDLKTRRIIGAEALARWTHPEKGPIAASEFIAAAEQHDRIGKLTAFMLDKAITAAANINRTHPGFEMSVNLSGRLLGDKALVGRIAILLERHRLDANLLTLELTETAALAGSGEALDMLNQLRELGVNISIDDYGTGLSTLEYLKKVPAGEIKIDQSFVRGMVENRSEQLMVRSTIALAHSLGRRVVAEGVETREALELLAEMECDIVQGFATGRPMSIESLRRRIAAEGRSKVA